MLHGQASHFLGVEIVHLWNPTHGHEIHRTTKPSMPELFYRSLGVLHVLSSGHHELEIGHAYHLIGFHDGGVDGIFPSLTRTRQLGTD
jgi:hypothetical protein